MYKILWYTPWAIQDKIRCDSSLNILIVKNGEGGVHTENTKCVCAVKEVGTMKGRREWIDSRCDGRLLHGNVYLSWTLIWTNRVINNLLLLESVSQFIKFVNNDSFDPYK